MRYVILIEKPKGSGMFVPTEDTFDGELDDVHLHVADRQANDGVCYAAEALPDDKPVEEVEATEAPAKIVPWSPSESENASHGQTIRDPDTEAPLNDKPK